MPEITRVVERPIGRFRSTDCVVSPLAKTEEEKYNTEKLLVIKIGSDPNDRDSELWWAANKEGRVSVISVGKHYVKR